MKEVYRTNKRIRKTMIFLKYLFGIGMLFFIIPGNMVPGQYYARMIYANTLYKIASYAEKTGEISRRVKQLSWKFNYLQRKRLLSPEILSEDILELCRLIDEASLLDKDPNQSIFDSLDYIHSTFLPNILKDKINFLTHSELQISLLQFLDLIAIKYKPNVEQIMKLKNKDPEEYRYETTLITQFVNLSLILLKYNQNNVTMRLSLYLGLEDIIEKTQNLYDSVDAFAIQIKKVQLSQSTKL
eukprot:403356822